MKEVKNKEEKQEVKSEEKRHEKISRNPNEIFVSAKLNKDGKYRVSDDKYRIGISAILRDYSEVIISAVGRKSISRVDNILHCREFKGLFNEWTTSMETCEFDDEKEGKKEYPKTVTTVKKKG